MKALDLTGQKFGRLTVIEFSHKSRAGNYWSYQCICGKYGSASTGNLRIGAVKSCGCLGSDINGLRKRPYESLYNWLIAHGARSGKIICDISYEDFLEFTKIQTCHYCGDNIVWAEFNIGKNGSAYNLDRKDNSIGYTKENCVVCCEHCNSMKSSMNYDDFIYRIRRIYKRINDR